MEPIFSFYIILPVHQVLSGESQELLARAIQSAINQNGARLVVVGPQEALDAVRPLMTYAYQQVVNTGDTGIATQINLGAQFVAEQDAEAFFTVLEFDDQLSPSYGSQMGLHTRAIPEVDVWLPLVASVDPTGRLIKYSNEMVWVPKSEEERPDGLLDEATAAQTADLLLSGALVRSRTYQRVGGLKAGIQITFVHEFFRRLVFQQAVVRGMAKELYEHQERRPGAYHEEIFRGVKPASEADIQHWLDVAAEEFRYAEDRIAAGLRH
jgi:hypothetical protein